MVKRQHTHVSCLLLSLVPSFRLATQSACYIFFFNQDKYSFIVNGKRCVAHVHIWEYALHTRNARVLQLHELSFQTKAYTHTKTCTSSHSRTKWKYKYVLFLHNEWIFFIWKEIGLDNHYCISRALVFRNVVRVPLLLSYFFFCVCRKLSHKVHISPSVSFSLSLSHPSFFLPTQ